MSDAPIPDIEARLIGISRNGVSNQAGESLSEIHSQYESDVLIRALNALNTIIAGNPSLLVSCTLDGSNETCNYIMILELMVGFLNANNLQSLQHVVHVIAEIISIACINLSSSHGREIKRTMISLLQDNIADVLEQTLDQTAVTKPALVERASSRASKLSVSIYIFHIVTLSRIRELLFLDTGHETVLINQCRKIAFCLKSQDPVENPALEQLYSIFYESMFYFSLQEDVVQIPKLQIYLQNLKEAINNPIFESLTGLHLGLSHLATKTLAEMTKRGLKPMFDVLKVEECDWMTIVDEKTVHGVPIVDVLDLEYLQIPREHRQMVQIVRQSLSDFRERALRATEVEKIYIINCLGRFACLLSGDFEWESHLCGKCDAGIIGTRKDADQDAKSLKLFFLHFSKEQDPNIRVALLLCIRRYLYSYDMGRIESGCGIWSLICESLIHPIREIRMLSSTLVPHYLASAQSEVVEANFKFIIKHLSSLRITETTQHLVECKYAVWGEMAKVLPVNEQLELVLVKFVDFIGSKNQVHSNIAFNQLKIVAGAKAKSPWQFLFPFLPKLSLVVVRQMLDRPVIITKVCDLLQTSLETFLHRSQAYTVPYLLMSYKHDLIGEIAKRLGTTKVQLVSKHLNRTVAYFLAADTKINELKIMQVLINACPEFKGRCLADLVSNHIELAWEILRNYSHEKQNSGNIEAALKYLASLFGSPSLESFFSQTILGIVQNFSETIHDTKGIQPFASKMESISAVEFLVTISGTEAIASSLPQIVNCLQSSLETVELHASSLRCLRMLIERVNLKNLSIIFDIVMSLILQKWNEFNKKCIEECLVILRLLFERASQSDRFHNYLFSLTFKEECATLHKRFQHTTSTYNLLQAMTARVDNGNNWVVLQALDDMESFFEKYKTEVHSVFFHKKGFQDILPKVVNTLLAASQKFHSTNRRVAVRAYKILGLIGCVDLKKFEKFENKKDMPIVKCDFVEEAETYKFLLCFIDNVLVRAFWTSNDPVKQLFLAYSMQEYLKMMNVRESTLTRQDQSTDTIVWRRFSELSRTTLQPLLTSKYIITTKAYRGTQYPVYKARKEHDAWLRELVFDLLRRVSEQTSVCVNAKNVFLTCSFVIKDQDLSICDFVLPYVSLSAVVSGYEELEKDLALEIKTVLETDNIQACYRSVFSVLDYFRKWVSKRKKARRNDEFNIDTAKVERFLERVPEDLMAKRSTQCGSYERAVLYLEHSFRNQSISDHTFFHSVREMYASIDDLDALNGVLKTFSDKILDQKALQLEYSSDKQVQHESLEFVAEKDVHTEFRLLESLQQNHLYDNVLLRLKPTKSLLPFGLESSIMSGRVSEIQKWVSLTESHVNPTGELGFFYNVAKALLTKKGSVECLERAFAFISTSTASEDIFARLHYVSDMRIALSEPNAFAHLKQRYHNIKAGFHSKWTILSVDRLLASLADNRENLNENWLESSKLARENNRLDLATKCIMNAMELGASSDLEYAELLWAQGDHSTALKTIRPQKENSAPIQLKYAQWLDTSANGSSAAIIEEYLQAIQLNKRWEEPYYHLAKYYNKILETNASQTGEYERLLIFNYINAITLGTTYLFEALPKVVTVWLDFCATYKKVSSANAEHTYTQKTKNHQLIQQAIHKAISDLPKYYWYVVLSQLISRLIHPDKQAQLYLLHIVAKVTQYYPEHTLWSVFTQVYSTDKERSKKGTQILESFAKFESKHSNANSDITASATRLVGKIFSVNRMEIPKGRYGKYSLQRDFGIDPNSGKCDSLVIPFQDNFEISIPAGPPTSPFPSKVVFNGFDDEVSVLGSMQKPRRLTIKSSDGRKRYILCKPHDDLRKDAKLMEFTRMIDRLLKNDGESEIRNLGVNSFAVVPLNEVQGVIEWVDRTKPMRELVNNYMSSLGNSYDYSWCRKILAEDKTLQERIDGFQQICSKYPPVLRMWFLDQFADPKSWYSARNNFTRSAAVMSMVGYLVGMGDRHGENILLCEENGAVMHVDFDCLFDKGLQLAVPERVPFRLTPNIVDAMGISGYEGTFRRSCEVTMNLIRNHESALMNVLETFIYDPIIDWTTRKKKKSDFGPQQAMANIRRKIRGVLDFEGLPVSVPGQVDATILQSVADENLAQMYIGWMPFL